MDINEFSKPHNLERNSFLWSEVRLIIAAVALFMGGVPPIYFIVPMTYSFFGIVRLGLTLAWIISGAASCYLLYGWSNHGQKLFGKKDQLDMIAFLVSVVSGINLGLAGILGHNIGMMIASGGAIFSLVGVVYIASAYQLYSRWKAHGERLF
jgi:uncharacterized membrane protein YuzA (DUF378 family)